MEMTSRARYSLLALMAGLSLIGALGRAPAPSGRSLTFWDGLWHGLIVLPYIRQQFYTTSLPQLYEKGAALGMIWLTVCTLLGFIISFVDSSAGDMADFTRGCRGCLVGVGLGLLIGAGLYWSSLGLIVLMAYLSSALGAWVDWLLGSLRSG